MIFEPRNIVLKNGAVCTLRPTHPDDSARMIDYLKQTSGETEYLLRYPDEVQYTLEQEQAILGRLMDDPKSVMMVGIVEGKVAGNCSVSSLGDKRKTRHRCSMGIALKEAYWNLGIGTRMFRELIAIAESMPQITQMELEFMEGNDRARRLYEKSGFRIVGVHPNAFRLRDGAFRNEYLMIREMRR